MPSEPVWLEQVHGTVVANAEAAACRVQADACIARHRGAVCVVMTADCLPVLLCDEAGTVVGAAHAGWKGLAAGVIEATVNAMDVAPHQLMAWLGPAIGPHAFEVGAEVRAAFMAHRGAKLPRHSCRMACRANTSPTSTCWHASGLNALGIRTHQWRNVLHLSPEGQVLFLPPRWGDRTHGDVYLAGRVSSCLKRQNGEGIEQDRLACHPLSVVLVGPSPASTTAASTIALASQLCQEQAGETTFHKFYYEPEFKGGNNGVEDCVKRE